MREQLISVIIADRPYRLNVSSEHEEQIFRQAGKMISEKMQEYASSFAFRDKQDLLAMVSLQLAVEMINQSHLASSQQLLKQKLEMLDSTLDESLKKIEANVLWKILRYTRINSKYVFETQHYQKFRDTFSVFRTGLNAYGLPISIPNRQWTFDIR